MAEALTDDQIEELREHFHVFDLNGSGWVEESDLKEALALLGTPKDNYEVRKLLQSIDTDHDGRLSFEEYIAWNRQLFIDEMRRAFGALDADGDGSIGKVELKAFATELGFGVTEEELDQLTYEMDTDQNDKISVEEFISALAQAKTGEAYYVINGELYMKKMKADFDAIDKDGSGYVEESELRQMANELAYRISAEELDALVSDMDENKDGKISVEEFIASAVKIRVPES
mmetsp:Transcript_135561/g.201588  ORF Transcript_135561/g.201588 Transcript_135561/m.201588 type:complete len:231 (-) Transcript_135561:140-832(-)